MPSLAVTFLSSLMRVTVLEVLVQVVVQHESNTLKFVICNLVSDLINWWRREMKPESSSAGKLSMFQFVQ
jgi:hypothetical protein